MIRGSQVGRLSRASLVRSVGHSPRMALRDAIKNGAASGRPVRPPNLRMADGAEMCGNCKYYRPAGIGKGVCRLYGGFPVRPQQVSDSFSAR